MKMSQPCLRACMLLACGYTNFAKGATEANLIIGSIGNIELRETEIRASLGNLGSSNKEALSRDPSMLNKLVRSMLVQRVVLKEALEKKWDEESSVAPLLKSTREAAVTDSYLKSLCQPPESYPSEAELKAAYTANRETFTVPRSFRLAQIYIADPEGVDKQAKARFETVRQRLQMQGADFGQIARELSEEKISASRDGEIGWLSEQQIQPEILAQLPQLRVNAVSEPVRLKDGWHLLKVLDAREPFTPIFDQVRAQLAQRLRAEKTRASMQAYMTEMLRQHPVAINEVALSKMFLPDPSEPVGSKP